jgi:hypothetical protein
MDCVREAEGMHGSIEMSSFPHEYTSNGIHIILPQTVVLTCAELVLHAHAEFAPLV